MKEIRFGVNFKSRNQDRESQNLCHLYFCFLFYDIRKAMTKL